VKRIAVALTALVLATPVCAQERIRSYNVEVDVRADGSLDVTERIAVRAEGQQIRRGIFRDFPTRYRDRYGSRVRVDFQMLGVERNGQPEPWFTERMTNGIRINTGNDNFLPVPADYTYTLRYRTTRQLGFFLDHDELYWNAIGTGWIFPIDSGEVEVRLPAAVPTNRMTAEGYTGPQGAKGDAYVAELAGPGVARYRLTQPLGSYEGFTIVLTFPKGLISPPTDPQRLGWFLRDNRGVLVALGGLIVLVGYCVREWRRVGRDPQKGIIIARYEPREGQTPAGLRYLRRMGYDMRCFSADVLALAVAGRVRINRDKHFFKDEWRLDRTDGASPKTLSAGQQALLSGLFPGGKDSLVLKNTNAEIVKKARDAHTELLTREYQPRYFKRNGRKVGIAWLIAIVTGIVAFIGSGGFGIPAIVAVMVVMLVTLIVFARLIRAPTLEGRALLDEIEGLKLYLSVAERDELASMRGPDEPPLLDAERYEGLLPFAVALEVEDAWTKKFTAAVGAAAAAEAASRMMWYSGRGPISDLGDFSRSIGSSLSSQISSASSPPGSSSGSGGGGSSGGGGGGGGGGGR
jgi:uncharacterized membrane protein YgcG